jgi:hypothetical protein
MCRTVIQTSISHTMLIGLIKGISIRHMRYRTYRVGIGARLVTLPCHVTPPSIT